MIKFEDLKIGDDIVSTVSKCSYKVVALGDCHVTLLAGDFFTFEKVHFLSFNWNYYTPPKEKKYVIMSPAIAGKYPSLITTSRLYESKNDAVKDLLDCHSWPALDGNGNPIQYKIEVKE